MKLFKLIVCILLVIAGTINLFLAFKNPTVVEYWGKSILMFLLYIHNDLGMKLDEIKYVIYLKAKGENMIGKTYKTTRINGIFGEVNIDSIQIDNEYSKTRHYEEEMDIETGKEINFKDETLGLPDGISIDTYFKMALIQQLESINRSLGAINKYPQVTVKLDEETIIKLKDGNVNDFMNTLTRKTKK